MHIIFRIEFEPFTKFQTLFSDQQHKIINSVIGHFIDAIPPGRDPKDFLRSSYRTRDSSEVYVALRLPIMRKLLDVNARKAFKDILDVHGGKLDHNCVK